MRLLSVVRYTSAQSFSAPGEGVRMNDKEQELLAQFHHTISEQLNSRLSESPKFFGLLVVVSTGYGYVLSNPLLYKQKEVFLLASLLSYAAVLWASWYLAALGYAFRLLQNSQHRIESALGWNPKYVPGSEDDRMTGQPPQWPPKTFRRRIDAFWLLPGIYHAHAAGLAVFLIIICVAFGYHASEYWPHCLTLIVTLAAVGELHLVANLEL